MTARRPAAIRRALALVLGLTAACAAPPAPSPVSARAMDEATLVVTLRGLAEDRLARAEAVAARAGATLVAAWPLGAIGRDCIVLRPAPGALDETLRRLGADREVVAVQPMQVFAPAAATPRDGRPAAAPRDAAARALAEAQPSLAALDAFRAHAVATGAGVTVALIDTGVDLAHPEFAGATLLARDFVDDAATPPPERHGTALAGVIAARARLRGVAFDARLLALRACWETPAAPRGRCSTASLARALNFAVERGADVVNLSVAGPPDPLLAELLDAAAAAGAVVVGAAGADPAGFPAGHPAALAARPAAPGSGPRDALPAPGDDVLSAAPAGGYDFFSGASVAAAHVAGVAALMAEARPGLAPAAARRALRAAVRAAPPPATIDACLAVAPPGGCAVAQENPTTD